MALTTGKRTMMEHEYQRDVTAWARHFKASAPRVRVRIRRGGFYRKGNYTISAPPNASRETLVHEFAHHLDNVLYHGHGHGASFRIALTAVATVVYGRPEAYPWSREYLAVQSWARKHELLRDDDVRRG